MAPTTCAACTAALPENASFCPTCGTPTVTRSAAPDGHTAPPPPPPGADRRHILQSAIGDSCEVRELIGRGGFAEVYAGWDVRLKREVAIKTVRADVSSTSILERFQREAEAVAKLRHPHIIPIYGVGEANGIAFFTMPRISGESLAAALEREKRMGVGEACRILSEAAGALEEAHRAGVVHRDIKPENIMLEGRDRRALVMDFGIAKSAGSEHGLTGTGMVMGTPQYMSPEQASGDRDVDHRSDQYSLAMIGYRMLTGRLPFEADSMQTLLVKQVTEVPPPLRTVAPEVPQRVAEAIERALAKRPEDRFASMAEFAAALSAARDTVGNTPSRRRRAVALPDRIGRMRALVPGWRHPLTLAGAASAIVFLALATRVLPPQARDVASQREEAEFAVRSALVARDSVRSPRLILAPESRTGTYDFLREAVGADSAARLADVIPIWLWHTRARETAGREFHVDVASGGRIIRYEVDVPDTATFPTVTPQAAESLAVAELVRYGVQPSALLRRPDSTVTRRTRTDHFIRWRDTAVAVAFNADTGFRHITVRVSGDRATDFTDLFSPARSWERNRGSTAFDVVATMLWLLVGGLMVYALIQAIARQRDDTIHWRTGLMIAAFVLVLLVLSVIPGSVSNLRFNSSMMTAVLGIIAMGVFFGTAVLAVVVFGYATGESIAAEHDLPMADGVADLARGRLATPELATGAVAGLLLGSIALGVHALNELVWRRLLGISTSPELPESLATSVPLTELFMNLGVATAACVAILLAQALAMRWSRRDWVAVLAPAVLLTGLLAGLDDMDAPVRLVVFVSALAVSYGVWRYGLVAGVLALFLYASAGDLAVFFVATGFSTGAIVALLALALPFVLGVRAWRTFRRA